MKKYKSPFWFAFFVSATLAHASFHTNTITTPGGGFAFAVDNVAGSNPTIELNAGVTNILNIQTAAFHPVVITTAPSTSPQFANASPQNVFSQPITIKTATTNFPTTLYYVCSIHGFFGQLHFNGPPPPNTVLEIRIGTNSVLMKSTGTNTTWTLVPEFSSNLVNGAWSPVPNFTNVFANGTNTTTFNRLDPICGPNVYLRLKQQLN